MEAGRSIGDDRVVSVPARQIRAVYTAETITVYQAYPPEIAEAALAAGRFVPPFKRDRMTWIKPSFLWMMYRCGWATKPGQERVLAVGGPARPCRSAGAAARAEPCALGPAPHPPWALGAGGENAAFDAGGSSLSSDARFVAFATSSKNITPEFPQGCQCTYVRDTQTGVTNAESRDPNATRTSSRTGTRSQTRGAVNPPADWATTTRSVLSPIASTTVSAYSERPAESSWQGRSGATVSCPR